MSVRKREWTTRKGILKEAWVVDYVDNQGKRRLKTFAKKKEADAFRDKTSSEVREGTHIPDRASITVKEAAENWIAAVGRGRGDRGPAEASTLRQYQYHAGTYIVPA